MSKENDICDLFWLAYHASFRDRIIKRILVAGTFGLIGATLPLSKALFDRGNEVARIDDLNGCYDVMLKYMRVERLPRAERLSSG